MKRKPLQSQANQPSHTNSGGGGPPPTSTSSGFPWDRFTFRLIDYGPSSEGCLEIEHIGEVVDTLGLSPAQTTVLRTMAAKSLDAGISHRAGRLVSTTTFIGELSLRHDDASGKRVWDAQAVHDLIYDIREKLRTSRSARWAVKDAGKQLDFGKLVLTYDAAYHKYGFNVPRARLEWLDYSEEN